MMANGKRILRVFPRFKKGWTPNDPWAMVGEPTLYRPPADEVHISVAFSWDMEEGRRLFDLWAPLYPMVRLGGPAFDGDGDEFVAGRYLRPGITITTRGCPNRCPWCLVQKPFRELDPVEPGWIIQDNNILAASRDHFRKVVDMLNAQRVGASFKGGFEAQRLTPWYVGQLQRLRTIKEIWLACDTWGARHALRDAVDLLKWLPRYKLRCYVMIGRDETLERAEARLEMAWDLGCMPFAQLYRPAEGEVEYSKPWRSLAKSWSRPASIKAMHRRGGSP